MPDKLSQSLDQILSERRKTNTRGGRSRGPRRSTTGAKPATTTPVGGVRKSVRGEKKPEKAVPTGPSGTGEGKIIVSNLPFDVTETQIKEYFSQSVGAVKKVLLSYGPTGKSRGVATINFTQGSSASKAAKELDGLKVDNRPMKIELILGAKDAPAPAAPKSLGDRVAQPKHANKDKPKPANADKAGTAAGAAKGAGRKRGERGGRGTGRVARGKPKSAEELDAEMADYWGGGENGPANGGDAPMANGGAVQPAVAATNGDTGMDDDVIV